MSDRPKWAEAIRMCTCRNRALDGPIALSTTEQIVAAVRSALSDQRHVVEFGPDGYGLQHPLSCRPDLLACPMDEMMRSFDGPPRKPGRYLAWFNEHGEVEFGDVGDYVDVSDVLRAALRRWDGE